MAFQVSLSQLFTRQLDGLKNTEDPITYKRVAQNIKETEKNLLKIEKAGISVHEMSMKNKVKQTDFTIVYKVKAVPKKKLIAKKIIK